MSTTSRRKKNARLTLKTPPACLRTEVEEEQQAEDDRGGELGKRQAIANQVAHADFEHCGRRGNQNAKLIDKAGEESAKRGRREFIHMGGDDSKSSLSARLHQARSYHKGNSRCAEGPRPDRGATEQKRGNNGESSADSLRERAKG